MKNVLKKVFELQQEVKAIEKDSNNPYFNSKYFDINKIIETIKPILKTQGLVITQPLESRDGKNILSTNIYDVESGECLISLIALPDNLEPQKMGSAITYYRRYSLQSLLLLAADDDDANLTQNSKSYNLKSNYRKAEPKQITPNTADGQPF